MRTIIKTVCLLVSLSFATQTQAQTKEETIAWLKEKLGKYMEGTDCKNIILQSINECEIVFTYDFISNDGTISKYKQVLPTSITDIGMGGAFFYDRRMSYFQKQGENKVFVAVGILKLSYGEKDIWKNADKALKHLATFCPKK